MSVNCEYCSAFIRRDGGCYTYSPLLGAAELPQELDASGFPEHSEIAKRVRDGEFDVQGWR
jgi:hypothetical protein